MTPTGNRLNGNFALPRLTRVPGQTPSSRLLHSYSGAIDGATVRYLTNATLGRNGSYRNLDVQNAYFEGRKPLPSEPGGRSLWAPVPEGWEIFGYKARASDGSRNWFEITGNVPAFATPAGFGARTAMLSSSRKALSNLLWIVSSSLNSSLLLQGHAFSLWVSTLTTTGPTARMTLHGPHSTQNGRHVTRLYPPTGC